MSGVGDSWNPDIFIENAIGTPTQKLEYGTERDGHGTNYQVIKNRMRGTFFQQMNMAEFPFDIQVSKVIIIITISPSSLTVHHHHHHHRHHDYHCHQSTV